MPSKRKTVKRKSRKCKKRVKKNIICFSSKNKKMTKKMKRIGKRLLKTKGIKLSRCSKKRLTSAKKRNSKKLKKKRRKKRSRNAKGTQFISYPNIGYIDDDIDDMNLETPDSPESPARGVVQNNIEFPTFSDDGNDITINIDGNQETVKENKGLNYYQLVGSLNPNTDVSLSLNRYRYSNGNIYKNEVKLDNNSNPDNGFITVIDIDYGGEDYIQLEDFICNYREENESFCYTHGHARDMPNENVDVYEIRQNNLI